MWRMALRPGSLLPHGKDCLRLTAAHTDQLLELYALSELGAFSPTQVEQGVFYGVLLHGQLVAAAGTHLVSSTYGVAAMGNIFTHPEHRRRGYGTSATRAVSGELLRRGINDIVLNVSQANAGAIRIYERLGFERYCSFLEGPASARRDHPCGHRKDSDE
jgi:predicted GNAT family acetyltransferase